MDNISHSKSAAGADMVLDDMFKYPEGLLTARNLVRALIHDMEVKRRSGASPSQRTIPQSFQPSRPVALNSLNRALTFSDPPEKRSIQQVPRQDPARKRLRYDNAAKTKPKASPKPKAEKKELAKYKLDHAVWMRILEFTPVQFLGKARLICKEFRAMVDTFTSIYVNCRKENFGHDMPPPPLGLTERQYSNLLRGKGCLTPGCTDKNALRTHWSWAKRWCAKCWKSKIEREDRLIKNRSDQLNRTTLVKLLECIPVGMHDSFMKPHDYIDVDDSRPRGAPKLYKYYLTEDIERIIRQYEGLAPPPFQQDPSKTAAENAAGLARYQEDLAGLEEKRAEFIATEKAKIDDLMAQVRKIEAAVRGRREALRTPYDENRNSRKELFTRRAKEDLPNIPEEFVRSTTAFKAACRVFRDGGTERGWQVLKPKIEKEWRDTHGVDAQEHILGPAALDRRHAARMPWKAPSPSFFSQYYPTISKSSSKPISGETSNECQLSPDMMEVEVDRNDWQSTHERMLEDEGALRLDRYNPPSFSPAALRMGPIFPGVIPVTMQLAQGLSSGNKAQSSPFAYNSLALSHSLSSSTPSSHISISSLIHPPDNS